MPLTPQDLANIAKQNKAPQEPGNYAIPKQNIDQQINTLPNANKLTQTEKNIYKALPGVTTWMENTKIFGTSFSDQLDKFNNGWAGKALQKLDFLAEGLERTTGLVIQMNKPGFDFKNLQAAWYAGSLTYDTMNLPQLVRSKDTITDPVTGRTGNPVVGLRIPTDLPGASNGLQDAQSQIIRLMQQGYEPAAALSMVRDEYYNGLGALALRSQLNDMYGHVLLDPLNVISGWLKPVQALKARRITAITDKVLGSADDIVQLAAVAAKNAENAGDVLDKLKFADEAYQLSLLAGDSKKAAEFGAILPDLAKQAGKLEDISRYTEDVAGISRIAGDAEEAAKYSEAALAALGRKKLNLADKAAIFLTGGDPLRPSPLVQKLSKVPVLGVFAKAMQLTPESKARELLGMFADNMGLTVSRLYHSPTAEADFVGLIHRMKKGATGIEFGHAMLTTEGRTVQGFLSGADFSLGNLLKSYEGSQQYRQTLSVISNALQTPTEKLLRLADENPTVLMKQLMEKAPLNPFLAEQIQAGLISPDTLRSLAKMFPEGVPHNKDMFFAQAMDIMETAMMRQAVVQFGVEAKGVLTRWSDAMKAAESLAFLKLSPAYPIRNAVNNEVTMIARGLFGLVGNQEVDNFWKVFGFTPQKLAEEGLSLETGKKVMSSAERVLDEALRGGHYTTADNIKGFFQKFNLGKLDATEIGGKLERSAGRRAQTLGTMQYLNRFYEPPKIQKLLPTQVMDAIDNVAPEFGDRLNKAFRAAKAMDGKLDELLGTNLNLSVDSILDDVTTKLGTDVRQIIGDETLEFLHQRLPKAIAEGKLDLLKVEMRSVLNRHVDDLFNKQIQNVVDHTKSLAVAGGPNVWNKKLAEASDLFWGYHVEYSTRMPEATRLAREASASGDFKLARALWEQEAADASQYYNRAFRRVDAYIQGLEEGTAELAARGANVPFKDVRKTFGQWKSSWEDFFTQKNARHDAFWKAFDEAPKGQKPSIDDLQAELSSAYSKQIAKEDELMQSIDDLIAGMIDDPNIRKSFVNARDAISELRRRDKQAVLDMYEKVSKLSPEERQAQWNIFWKERETRLREIRAVNAAANAIQQGDPGAIAKFQGVQSNDIYSMANAYGIPSASEAGIRNDRRILSTINKYLPEGTEKFKSVADIPEDVARQAFEERILEKSMLSDAKFVEERSRAVRYPDYALAFTKKYAPEKIEELKLLSGSENRVEKIKKFIRKIEPPKREVITRYKQPSFVAPDELSKMLPDPAPIDLSTDLMNYGRVMPMVDEVANEAVRASQKTPLMLKDLPENLQGEVMKAIRQVKNDFASTRYKALKFGQWRKDAALLNYNRRTNFDNWLGHVAPFGFWSTHSMFNWAIESIDRPAMITNYLRVKKMLATSGLERDGMASRTKGKIRIELPFAPDWMGEAFIDPLRLALPFEQWASPFENWQKDMAGVDGRTQRNLEQMLSEGKISEDEYQKAITNRTGDTWDFAKNMTLENDSQDRYDAWDFATGLQAPHAPLAWAFNASFGDKENIGPFAPMSRIARNAATLMGVEDWNNSKWNVEAKIRKQLGLPAFDKWDDYRIKRSASNLAGEGLLTPDEAKEAIAIAAMVESGKLSPEEAKKQSEPYRMSVARSNQEFTGGGSSFIASLLGLSITSVPVGENNLRALQDDFGLAYSQYAQANASLDEYIRKNPQMTREEAEDAWEAKNPKLAQEADALTKFFDDHPEYETRLGLFDKPEVQIQKFMVDEVWKTYNELPKVNKDEAREHLGQEFQETFLDPATRNTDEVPAELMAVWLKMLNVDPKGGLTADQRLLVSLYGKVQFTDPDLAWRVETFYNQRKTEYPEFYDLQNQYYELPKNQRKAFLNANPQLREYWDFRRQFMRDNPDLVPYMTDDEKAIERAKNQTRTENAVPTPQELQVQLTPEMNEILSYYFESGTEIPSVVMNELDYLAQQQGLTDGAQLLNIIQGQY